MVKAGTHASNMALAQNIDVLIVVLGASGGIGQVCGSFAHKREVTSPRAKTSFL